MKNSPRIQRVIGQLPCFSDTSTLFFANILSIFFGNKLQTQLLREEVGDLEFYGNRLLPILNVLYPGSQNILFLETSPNQHLLRYFKEELLLNLPHYEVLFFDDYLKLLKNEQLINEKLSPYLDRAVCLDGYVTDDYLERLAKKLQKPLQSSKNASYQGNHKGSLHLFLEENCPEYTYDTQLISSQSQLKDAVEYLLALGYQKGVLKSGIGASGIGIQQFDLADVKKKKEFEVENYFFYSGDCLVQGWIEKGIQGVAEITSPSVQLYLKEGEVILYDLTDQILSERSIHEGNIAPPSFYLKDQRMTDMLIQAGEVAGKWLYGQGYRGTASVDCQMILREGAWELKICEINARVTGATYPALLAHTLLPDACWLLQNIRFEAGLDTEDMLTKLEKEKLLFHVGMKSGIIPFNVIGDNKGDISKGQFLFLAEERGSLLEMSKTLLKIPYMKGFRDRD